MNEELIILVDNMDREIGYADKINVHRKGLKHRAFSVFIFNMNDRKVLMQKRAKQKYHSGGLWSNSCCSHPGKGEDIHLAVLRRIKQELGLDISPEEGEKDFEGESLHGIMFKAGVFSYYKCFGDMAENEIDYVFYILIDSEKPEIVIDPEEVEETAWVTVEELESMVEKTPEQFTAWFPQAYFIFRKHMEAKGLINCQDQKK